MKTLRRHYIWNFTRLYLVLCLGLGAVFSIVDLIDKLDNLMPFGPAMGSLALFPLLNFPKYLLYVMPVGALLSGLYTVGQASKHREIVAVMAAGGRVRLLLAPFVAVGMLLSLLGFLLGEFVVPASSTAVKAVERGITKRKDPSVFDKGTVWFKAKGGGGEDGAEIIARMELFVPEKDLARGISIFKVKDGMLVQRMEAQEAAFENGRWVLKGVTVYDLQGGPVVHRDVAESPLLPSPEFLKEDIKDPEEMGFFELSEYLLKLRAAGFGNARLSVDLHSKLSFPLVNLFMLVIGVSFSVRRQMSGAVAAAVGVLISLLYWLGYTMSLFLGYTRVFPPTMAAWLPVLVFGVVAACLFLTVPE